MTNWECPECSEPCKDVKEHVTHIIEKHMLESAAKSPSRTQKQRRQPSGKDGDFSTAKGVPNETTFTCPFPGCENHRKVYKRKQHLKRHYLDLPDVPCDGREDPKCWRCHTKFDTLGALTRHIEKTCSERKKEGNGEEEELSAIEKQWMQKIGEMKEKETVHLDRKLSRAPKQKSKRPRTEEAETALDEAQKRKQNRSRTEEADAMLNVAPKQKLKGRTLQRGTSEDRGSGRCEFGAGVGGHEANGRNEISEEVKISRQEPVGSVLESNIGPIASRDFADGNNAVTFATTRQIQEPWSLRPDPIPLPNNANMQSISAAPAAVSLHTQGQAAPSFPCSDGELFKAFEEWWEFDETMWQPYPDTAILDCNGGLIG